MPATLDNVTISSPRPIDAATDCTIILAGNLFSSATVSALVEMYDAIDAGIVAPETGRENVRGRTSLQQAARGLLG